MQSTLLSIVTNPTAPSSTTAPVNWLVNSVVAVVVAVVVSVVVVDVDVLVVSVSVVMVSDV